MKNFRRDNKSGNRNSRRSGGRNSDRNFSMHKAICAGCGESCEVPFRPTGNKPVYCSECFENMGGNRNRSSRRPDRGNERRGSDDRKMFSAVCDACGKSCKVPFRPSGNKPIYCDDCFEDNKTSGSKRSAGNEEITEQLDALNTKLDRLIEILTPEVTKKSASKKEEVKTIKTPKESKPKKTVKKTKKTVTKKQSKKK